MRQLFPSRSVIGLGVLAAGGLWAAYLAAQPPAPPPPPGGQFMTVRGTVKEFTTAPRGEVDGLMLSDGTSVHWPPHLQDRFKDLAARGDRVRASGYWETGPAGDAKLEVSTLTNLGTDKSADNPDRPAPGRAGEATAETQTVRGKIDRFTTAPRGETDGAVLDNGTWLHWPPHLQDRFTDVLKVGDRVRAAGRTETGPAGDTHFEVRSVANLRTNNSADNPDFDNGPPPPPPPRGPRGRADRPPPPPPADLGADRDQRLRALERQVEQLRREIERLRREK
jgi:hypothetical protein